VPRALPAGLDMTAARDPRAQVRRDLRAFVLGAALALVALALLVTWRAGFVGTSAGRASTGAAALGATVVAAAGWLSGEMTIRERLFVLAPALLASPALGVAVGSLAGGIAGLAASILVALVAAAALGVSRRRG